MTSPTPNKGYTYPAHGGAVNAWDTPLNTNFDYIDMNLGGGYKLTISSTTAAATFNSSFATIPSTAATITPNSSLAQNLYYYYSGTMTNDQDIALPAAGGMYIINNASSGAFSLRTTVSGSTAVNASVAQGGTSFVVTTPTEAYLADTNVVAKLTAYLGNPNGNVAGTAASANGGQSDARWDVTNKALYVATTTGTSATTVWTPVAGALVPQGYLTIATDNNNPVVASNVTAATTVKYVPFVGNWTVLSDGTTLYPYQFSAMTLTLTAAQAANIIYDVFMFYNAGTPIIGTGPAWSISTAALGARGTGAGTTQLTRTIGGIWTNAVAVTLTNNGTPYACGANQGVYLGSIYMDGTGGQLSCLPAYGQSRKFGVWNAYNRKPIVLQAGDSTASWTYTTATFRAANGNSANSLTLFTGLPEEWVEAEVFMKAGSGASSVQLQCGIGVNSTSTPTGFVGAAVTDGGSTIFAPQSEISVAPTIGINVLTMLEYSEAAGTTTWRGGSDDLLLTARYMG